MRNHAEALPAIRDDLAKAHQLAWDHLGSPGTWWTAAQRVELASTVLMAISDDEPVPPWVGVSTTDQLPQNLKVHPAAHDVAYRIARHAGTMTANVHRRIADDIGELPFVELCAIVSSVAAIAHFRRNVGDTPPSLPDPVAGDPSFERPDGVVSAELNWVPVVGPADQTAAVLQAYSAVPAELENTWRMASAQYIPADEMIHADWSRGTGSLTRPQIELVAARVSQLRECFY
jgi:hypothetical protein